MPTNLDAAWSLRGRCPVVSVVIPTYQRRGRCERLLRHLTEQTLAHDDLEVIVVDNGSDDGTDELLRSIARELPYRLRPARIEENCGPAPARNLGWRTAQAPIIAFTDDDCLPAPGWLQAGLDAFALAPDLGVVQGATRTPPGTEPIGAAWRHELVIDRPTPHFEACNIFYRRAALEAGGGFSEELGWWGEDAAAGWSVIEAGWRRSFAPDAEVTHDVEVRSFTWQMRTGLLEANLVTLAAEHAGFRHDALWRPWAVRDIDATFTVAGVALLAGLAFRPALLLTLPYLFRRRPPRTLERDRLKLAAQVVAVDAARSLGHLAGSARNRIMVL